MRYVWSWMQPFGDALSDNLTLSVAMHVELMGALNWFDRSYRFYFLHTIHTCLQQANIWKGLDNTFAQVCNLTTT